MLWAIVHQEFTLKWGSLKMKPLNQETNQNPVGKKSVKMQLTIEEEKERENEQTDSITTALR